MDEKSENLIGDLRHLNLIYKLEAPFIQNNLKDFIAANLPDHMRAFYNILIVYLYKS